METFSKYIILFALYSFFGWIFECIVVYFYTKKVMNRGFLIGPCCPIYGFGSLAIVIFLSRYKNDPIVLFTMTTIICSTLEYFTSWIMEKLFKARWWDYSDKKYHINGRICLTNAIAFGVLGLLVVNLIQPLFNKYLALLSIKAIKIIGITLLVLYLIDITISFKIINSFKKTASSIKKDNTEEITKKVKEKLLAMGGLYKRLVSAFDFSASDNLLISIRDRVKNETMKAKRVIANEKLKIKLLNKKVKLEEQTEKIDEEIKELEHRK